MAGKRRKSGSGHDGARSRQGGRSRIDPRSAIVISLVGLAGAVLLWIYAGAVADGLGWHQRSELQLIAPDLEQRDTGAARQIPDFALKDRFGRTVRLSQFAEIDLLLVNIWSSGCRVCLEEVPELTEMDRRIGELGKAALITIAVEQKWEDVSYYFPKGTDLRILFDPDDKVAKGIFGTSKYPETFVLDKQRRVRARFDGKRPWHSPVMFDYLSSFL